ncbi:MAG TPA: T9SS type A sorting domain-containing protein, partial [Bacteroidales bacterium]|nr:T9SS type A sorting domain-containing protein [Bacteroidales bacterium]
PHSSSINYKTEDGIRKLTYSFGWGDCIAGCIHWKHWNIKVYNDCSVELVGHDPDYTYVSDFNKIETINLSPNPFNDLIVIETKNNYNYDIISLTGITLIKGELFVGENIIETNDLPGGVYVIYIYDSKSYSTYVIIKRDF